MKKLGSRLVGKANRRLTVGLAASLLASSSLLASLLGIFRERLLNSTYLQTYPTGIDAYTVAFLIPDFMFFILTSGALSVSFIPVFNERLLHGNKRSAWELSTSMVNLFAIVTLIASVLIIILADPLVRYVVGPGLNESGRGLAIAMMRIIAINPFLFAIATVLSSMQQAVGRFVFFAVAPMIYNLGIIIGVLFFTNGISLFGIHIFDGGIMGVAFGVVLGSILNLLIVSIGLLGLGFDYRFKIYWKNRGLRNVLRLLPARSLDQGIDYVNAIVETNLASRMAAGTIRAYQQASTLYMMPVNLIGVAISTAAFPKMTERLATGQPGLFRSELQSVIRVIIWLTLPVAVIAFFGRGYVVSFIVNGGNGLIANLLGLLALAIVFRAVYHIVARSFYAQQDTKTPLIVSIFTIGLNIVLAVTFTLGLHSGPSGLALAQVIVAGAEIVILGFIMARRIPDLFDVTFVHAVGRMVGAVTLTGVVTYIVVSVLPLGVGDQSFFAAFPKFVIITIISLGTYLWLSKVFRLKEANPVIARLRTGTIRVIVALFKQFRAGESGGV
jgi:putative peptidoglycan lipid II flippase